MNTDEKRLFKHLLWPFRNLPENYVVLDTETTGLFDEEGAPGIVSIGIVEVINRKIVGEKEYAVKPHRHMTHEALQINGISEKQAQDFPSFTSQWQKIKKDVAGKLVIIHNAAFDWPLILEHINRYGVDELSILGVFCSQRAAQPWAKAMGLKTSDRGPSLDTLTKATGVNDLRHELEGLHRASKDARQAAEVVEALRRY